MFAQNLLLPEDWFKVKISPRDNLFVNLKQELFSLTPVCSLHQLPFVLQQTKINPNFKDLNKMLNIVQSQIKEIEKLRTLRQNIDPIAQD